MMAKETKAVITRYVYYKNQFVDSKTGVLTPLKGEALKMAKEAKTVVSKNTYCRERLLADAKMRTLTRLEGKAIALTQTAKTIEETAKRKRNDSAELEDIDVLDAQNQSCTHEQKKLKLTTDSCSTGLTQFGFLSRPIEVMQVEPLSSRQEDDSVTAITL